MSDFVHLHCHSHYSLLDGACSVKTLVDAAVENEMKAVALTDHGNMFGAIEFYKYAQKKNIQPIIGMEAYVARGSLVDKQSGQKDKQNYFHLILLAKNEQGYLNLLKLSSIGYLDGFYYRPRIDDKSLENCSDGIISTSACIAGEVQFHLKNEDYDKAKEKALYYQKVFKDNFFLEIMDHGIPEEVRIREPLIRLSKETGIPIVATNDSHYIKKEHSKAQEIMLCIRTGDELDSDKRFKFSSEELYFKSEEEMRELFPEIPEAITNTALIAEKCNLDLDFSTHHLPKFPLPDTDKDKTLDEYLVQETWKGLENRYDTITDQIKERTRFELKIMKEMGFAGYFLIVKDFIDFARSESIPVGPGRGSAAGSLVAFALGITNIDPLKYNLLFERFLNPERISMPDIDIDFSDERRDEILSYVKRKYGEDNVSQIITFGTMAARAAVKDVGRVMGIPYSEVDAIAKLIPKTPGISLKQALKASREFKEKVDSTEDYRQLMEYARVLEGLARNASTHACGVVITPTPLTDYAPLYKHPKTGDINIQFTMKIAESIGLLKMDFLGLRTLSVIENSLKYLKNRNIELDIDSIPLNDAKTFDLFKAGSTVAVFQFESSGMQEYLRKLKPEVFEDLIAMNALYRPGPLGSNMVDSFINRKHGTEKIEYIIPELESILKETYGIIVYQEQVMQIASRIAGFSLGKADIMRKAMGKKILDQMLALKEDFIEGGVKLGHPKKDLKELFEQIEKFAQYGFNKSHSACYALVAYQTAYLKANYPAELMSATLTSELNDSDRILIFTEECKKMGIKILPPDVNESGFTFKPVDNNIRYGLGGIKNVGKTAINSTLESREKDGLFKTIFDLVSRVDSRVVNKKVMESLVQSGALDSIEGTRSQLMAVLEKAILYGQSVQEEKSRNQINIFAMGDGNGDDDVLLEPPSLPEIESWSRFDRLAKEKELLGFYISGHPLSQYENEIKEFSSSSIAELAELSDGSPVRIGAIISKIKYHKDRKNNTIAFLTIEDFTGTTEVLCFADTYGKYSDFIQADALIMVTGKISEKDSTKKILANEFIFLSDAREKLAKSVFIKINTLSFPTGKLNDFSRIFRKYKGECELYFLVETESSEKVLMKSGTYKVKPQAEFIKSLQSTLGEDCVTVK